MGNVRWANYRMVVDKIGHIKLKYGYWQRKNGKFIPKATSDDRTNEALLSVMQHFKTKYERKPDVRHYTGIKFTDMPEMGTLVWLPKGYKIIGAAPEDRFRRGII